MGFNPFAAQYRFTAQQDESAESPVQVQTGGITLYEGFPWCYTAETQTTPARQWRPGDWLARAVTGNEPDAVARRHAPAGAVSEWGYESLPRAERRGFTDQWLAETASYAKALSI
ncbi:MAG: hypothetical protein R3E42_05110 [Burkholderiaceae bacterium]